MWTRLRVIAANRIARRTFRDYAATLLPQLHGHFAVPALKGASAADRASFDQHFIRHHEIILNAIRATLQQKLGEVVVDRHEFRASPPFVQGAVIARIEDLYNCGIARAWRDFEWALRTGQPTFTRGKWCSTWQALGYILPRRIRFDIYEPYCADLVADYMEIRQHAGSFTRAWIDLCFAARTIVAVLSSLRVWLADSLLRLAKSVVTLYRCASLDEKPTDKK
jgi:hypothetical protein